MPGKADVPRLEDLICPVLQALKDSGTAVNTAEMRTHVIADLKLPPAVVKVLHQPGKSKRTALEYRLAWARTYLKKSGMIESPSRGMWRLTAAGIDPKGVDPRELVGKIQASDRRKRKARGAGGPHTGEGPAAHSRRKGMPQFQELMNPLLRALHKLGGSGSIDEICDEVIGLLGLPDGIADVVHDPERSNMTEVGYRLAWARTYLKKAGLLDNSKRGVWSIVGDKQRVQKVDPVQITRTVRAQDRASKAAAETEPEQEAGDETVPEEAQSWRTKLHHVLTRDLTAEAFERLTKRLLREAGFVQVEVTGRSGDGGIDGKGIMRLGGLLSFHVVFQCKRYQGTVSASHVRDFRGAMIGRADKGLFITTGSFSKDAVREATRDGAPPIDLVDGDQLADKLKDLGLGVQTKTVERVTVDPEWFATV